MIKHGLDRLEQDYVMMQRILAALIIRSGGELKIYGNDIIKIPNDFAIISENNVDGGYKFKVISKTNNTNDDKKPIISRGKIVGVNEWVYGYYVRVFYDGEFKHYILPGTIEDRYKNIIYKHEVAKETVGMYTGTNANDNNDTRIFVGDIIEYKKVVAYDVSEKETAYDVVEFIDGAFTPVFLMNRGLHDFDDKPLMITDVKVIGNKIDNPTMYEAVIMGDYEAVRRYMGIRRDG